MAAETSLREQPIQHAEAGGALARLLAGYSVEVTARDRSAPDICGAYLPRGSVVYIAAVPGDTHHQLVTAARRLRLSGFRPVPHIAARGVLGYTQLNDLLSRLSGDAGVTDALVIGGDIARPSGPYESSLKLLQTGLFQKHGIGRIGLACYPEAHPRIGIAVLAEALRQKLAVVDEAGLSAFLVTQFCFEAAPVLALAQLLRANRIAAPLRVAIAGPNDRRTLWKYAMHCGVGASIRVLGAHVDALGHLLLRDTPDGLVAQLADSGDIDGIHILPFGNVAGAATWANGVIARG